MTLLCASAARADVTAVTVHGDLTDRERRETINIVIEAGRAAGWAVTPATFTDAEILPCLKRVEYSNQCISPIARAKEIDHLIVIYWERDPADESKYRLTEVFLTVGLPTHAVQRWTCAPCNGAKLGSWTFQFTNKMIKDTAFELKTDPPGGVVRVDMQPIATGQLVATAPGDHVVTVELPGFQRAEQVISVELGQTTKSTLELQPVQATLRAEPPAARRPARWAAVAVLGAGAGLVGYGLYSFDRGLRRGPDREYLHSNATAIGVGSGLVGTAVVAFGSYLLSQRTRAAAPVVGFTANGAMISWTGTFR